MRNSTRVVASVLAASLAVAACAKTTSKPPPPPPPGPPPAPQAKITFNYPIKPCPPGTNPSANEHYTITLGPNFSLNHPVVSFTGPPVGPSPHPPTHHTRLDLVTNLLHANAVGTVTIVLASNSYLHFGAHGVAGQQDLAFEGADANAAQIFCGVTYGTSPESLTFTVIPNASAPYASYILGLVADEHPQTVYTLPIFIDPGVDNQGA
jgi:hypothetical protein